MHQIPAPSVGSYVHAVWAEVLNRRTLTGYLTFVLIRMLHITGNEEQRGDLRFRPFRKGFDEPVWVEIANLVYAADPNWGGITVDSMIESEKSPRFRVEGRFIVEFGAKPIGMINAHAAAPRDDKKGFVYTFGVRPDLEEEAVEEAMMRFVITNLRQRGMRAVNFWIYDQRTSLRRTLEKFGFELVRTHSTMEIDLAKRPRQPRPLSIEVRSLDTTHDSEIEDLTWLQNECFKDEYDYRPRTVKDMRCSLLEDPYLKRQECFFAMDGDQKIGYIRFGIDQQYNEAKNVKAGFIPAFGVLESHRRKGVGTQLMLKALETLEKKGMEKAQLGVDDLNPTMAKKFYEKIGFQCISRYLAYEKTL